MHSIWIVVIVIVGLIGVGGLTFLITRLAVGKSSYHELQPLPPPKKPPTVYFQPLSKQPSSKQPSSKTPQTNQPHSNQPLTKLMSKYAEYKPIDEAAYVRIPKYDSPGNDMGKATDASNYNMTVEKCKERCDKTQGCVAFGWDASQKNYCTNKNKISDKLSKWNGDLYIKA